MSWKKIEILPNQLRLNATELSSAAHYCLGDGQLHIAGVVNACLCAELFLKYFLTVKNKQRGNHDLKSLFDDVDRNIQEQIVAATNLDWDIFIDSLTKHKNHFDICMNGTS